MEPGESRRKQGGSRVVAGGNTDTRQKDKQDPTQSGFDSTADQEGKNVICTNANNNCIQEGQPVTLRPGFYNV
jgi:hypothetical protein